MGVKYFYEEEPSNTQDSKSNAAPTSKSILSCSQACEWDGKPVGEIILDAVASQTQNPVADPSSVNPNVNVVTVTVKTNLHHNASKVFLHWATPTMTNKNEWCAPPHPLFPPKTVTVSNQACQTPFISDAENGFKVILIQIDPTTNHAEQINQLHSLKFVIRRCLGDGNEQWFSFGKTDFVVPLAQHTGAFAGTPDGHSPGDIGDEVEQRILDFENQGQANFYGRFCTILECIPVAQASKNIHPFAWIYTDMRLHYLKCLKWYSGHSNQSKDIGHIQDVLSKRMATAALYAENIQVRQLAKAIMPFLSRGGGQAEAIRLEILNIMRRHGIKEGHRPGIDCKFLEQWHQKLHQNTSAEDIVIAKAYLHFLHTGNQDDFWHALWTKGKLTRERLASFANPITATPLHLPQLIPDMKHYLWILQTVHGGTELHFIIESSKWALEKSGDNEAIGFLYEIMNNFNDWWVPGKIAETRQRLVHPIRNVFCAERDLLLLDAALEGAFKTTIERTDIASLSGDSLIDIVDLILSQELLSRDFDPEFQACLSQWRVYVKDVSRWNKTWALQAKAISDRIALTIATYTDNLYSWIQPKAEKLAEVANIDRSYVENFAEEVIRGQPLFLISLYFRHLDPLLRDCAGIGPWQVVSSGVGGIAYGSILHKNDLADIQGQQFKDQSVVLVIDQLDPSSDIPQGINAILSGTPTDVLSHVAIRARNQNVLLAYCDKATSEGIVASFPDAQSVQVIVDHVGAVNLVATDANQNPTSSNGSSSQNSSQRNIEIVSPKISDQVYIQMQDFLKETVGNKSLNLKSLQAVVPDNVSVPKSRAIPFGTFERLLDSPENKSLSDELRNLIQISSNQHGQQMSDTLEKERTLVETKFEATPEMKDGLTRLLQEFQEKTSTFSSLWNSIRSVWASKWTDRAVLSRRTNSIPDDKLYMAVLLQYVVHAEYAFVIHTAHPITKDRDTIFGELVLGLGETLVGGYPGRAFSFSVKKMPDGSFSDVQIHSFPSKRIGLYAKHGLMVRSDSNGEDLEDFAGAGLYDSVLCGRLETRVLDYSESRLFKDEQFRSEIMQQIARCGAEVERALNGVPQDVEGCIDYEGNIVVVQTRPQVL